MLPTPDELVIYAVGGFLFSYAFHMPLLYVVLLTMIMYRGLGAGCLVGSLLVGGEPIYYMFENRFKKNRGLLLDGCLAPFSDGIIDWWAVPDLNR
ncbi:MAG: hypothetical protein ABSF44_04920 [Candidatus Bathyarchaeia archaeon]